MHPQRVLLVECDNVTSKQFMDIRKALRGTAEVCMGKNTQIRRLLKMEIGEHPEWEQLLNAVSGNVGFVFTSGDLKDVRDMLLANRRPAAAKAGAIAPVDVTVPAMQTELEPTQTSFLQALGISSKISKGKIEILQSVQVIFAGKKVGGSEAALLNKLNIQPFAYGLSLVSCYDDGAMFDPAVLDLTPEKIRAKFTAVAHNVAALSFGANFATKASAPHSLINAYRNVLALALENTAGYTTPAAEAIKEAMANKAAAPAATETAAAVEEEEEEEESSEGGMDMFGGSDSD